MAKVKLGDVAREYKSTIKDGTNLPSVGLEHLIPGEIELTQWSDDSDNTFTKSFKKGQILFGRRRAYLRKAAVAPFDGICSGDITVIEAIPEKIMPELLPFVIQNDYLFDYAVEKSAGSLSPRVKWEHLKNYEFELPDYRQQKDLVNLLWAMARTKKAYLNLLKKTDELVEAQFVEMINKSDQANTLGCFIKRSTPKRCGDRDLPVLSVTKKKAIVLQDERFDSTVVSRDKTNYIIAPKGFIVQGIHIDEGNFGLQNIVEEGIVSPAYKLWQIISPNVIPELLEYYLRSQQAIDYYSRNFLGSTVKRRQVIRTEDLLSMPTNIPSMPKQKAFWEIKLQSDKSKEELTKAISRIDDMVKAFMQE